MKKMAAIFGYVTGGTKYNLSGWISGFLTGHGP